jgi:hypothetical protein
LIYSSLQAADPSFFGKVLFAIDNALQIHWRSSSVSEDRTSVDDRILLLSDTQDSIICHSFIQQIPKSLIEKVNTQSESLKDGKSFGGSKHQNKQGNGSEQKGGEKSEIITDSDKSHSQWRAKNGEDFAKVFYKNQHQCPKTKDGKIICMKLFIRGFCDKSCNRVHKLTPEDEKSFGEFILNCREGASKPDF